MLSRSNTVLTISHLLMLLRSFRNWASRSERTESPTHEPLKNVNTSRFAGQSKGDRVYQQLGQLRRIVKDYIDLLYVLRHSDASQNSHQDRVSTL